jgi:hypothetical protein
MSSDIARSVIDVIVGEAGGTTRKQRYENMKAVASTILMRSIITGESLESVIAGEGQFDAYGKALPLGKPAFRDLARQALDDVLQNGPIDYATTYARGYALSRLSPGLKEIGLTQDRHHRFVDPQMRPLVTAHRAQPVNDYARMMRPSTVRPTLADRFPVVQEQGPSPPGFDDYVQRLRELLARQPRTTPKEPRVRPALPYAAPSGSTFPQYASVRPTPRPDPMGTRSIPGASSSELYDTGRLGDDAARANPFAVLDRAGPARPFGAPQGQPANNGPLDNVALTRVVRQMQSRARVPTRSGRCSPRIAGDATWLGGSIAERDLSGRWGQKATTRPYG